MKTNELKATIQMLERKYRRMNKVTDKRHAEITLKNIEKYTLRYIETTNELPS